MRMRTRATLIAVAVVFLAMVVLAPLSKAQVAGISKGALLIQKSVLALPRVLGHALLGASAAPAAKGQDQSLKAASPLSTDAKSGVIVGHSVKNDTSPPLRDIPPAPTHGPAGARRQSQSADSQRPPG